MSDTQTIGLFALGLCLLFVLLALSCPMIECVYVCCSMCNDQRKDNKIKAAGFEKMTEMTEILCE